MNYGFITVASAIPSVRVADVDYNIEQISYSTDTEISEKSNIWETAERYR